MGTACIAKAYKWIQGDQKLKEQSFVRGQGNIHNLFTTN